jgi:hypothetical protein
MLYARYIKTDVRQLKITMLEVKTNIIMLRQLTMIYGKQEYYMVGDI